MEKPAGRRPAVGGRRVGAIAEQPEAAAVVVLDPVVVAERRHDIGRRPAAVGPGPPPFVGQPLRPLGAHDAVGVPAPVEHRRRIVGHEGRDIDRLGPLQQSRRPRALERRHAGPGAGRGSLGRDGGRRLHALGQVAVARQQPHHVLLAQPQRQPVGEVDRAVLAQRGGERARVRAAHPACR